MLSAIFFCACQTPCCFHKTCHVSRITQTQITVLAVLSGFWEHQGTICLLLVKLFIQDHTNSDDPSCPPLLDSGGIRAPVAYFAAVQQWQEIVDLLWSDPRGRNGCASNLTRGKFIAIEMVHWYFTTCRVKYQ